MKLCLDNSYFIHPQAIVETKNIGKDTKIWAFTHIQENVEIGSNCNIGEGCFIENGVVIGNDVVVKNHISIWDGIVIGDRVFLGPNVVLTNDLYPRSKIFHSESIKTLIDYGASIGANATIICGVRIGRFSMTGAGSVVTNNVNDFSLIYGNPARFKSWICICTKKFIFKDNNKYTCVCGRQYKQDLNGVVKLLKDIEN
jgi:acetyltransferase-like isoleucine patch superfamily enzyme